MEWSISVNESLCRVGINVRIIIKEALTIMGCILGLLSTSDGHVFYFNKLHNIVYTCRGVAVICE